MSGITDSEVEVGDLRGNEWHTFKVRAVNGGGMGEYSEELRSRSSIIVFYYFVHADFRKIIQNVFYYDLNCICIIKNKFVL